MTQATTWGVPLAAPSSKTNFATRTDDSLDALLSAHKGSSAPSYAVAGTIWCDDAADPLWTVKAYDGTDWMALFTLDTTNNRVVWHHAGSVDAASASTVDLGAVTSNLVRITGTTTITAFGTAAAGTRRILRFAAALTLTHNATSLILPGGSSILTAANDVAICVSEGSGNWRVVAFIPANPVAGLVDGGALTLTSGVPILTSAVAGATTLYFTPYLHDRISLFDGVRWRTIAFAETSLSVAALTADTNYDLFGSYSAGALALEALAWSDATTRATALTRQNGVRVKSGDATRRWLGSFRINASGGEIDWSPGGSGAGGVPANLTLFNATNRVRRVAVVRDSTSSWSYSTEAYRSTNNSTGNRVNVLLGEAGVPVRCHYLQRAQTAATVNDLAIFGIGLDSTSSPSGTITLLRNPASAAFEATMLSNYNVNTLIGSHYLQALEFGSTNTTTISGSNELMVEVWQ